MRARETPWDSSCGVSPYPVCNHIRAEEQHAPSCIQDRKSVYCTVGDVLPSTSYLRAKQAPWDSSCGAFHAPVRLLYCTVAPGCAYTPKGPNYHVVRPGDLFHPQPFSRGCGQIDNTPLHYHRPAPAGIYCKLRFTIDTPCQGVLPLLHLQCKCNKGLHPRVPRRSNKKGQAYHLSFLVHASIPRGLRSVLPGGLAGLPPVLHAEQTLPQQRQNQ